jgi:hypothetical protein
VPIGIKHTNCFLKIKKNFISFWVTVFFALLNNLCHSKIKRFNLIVSDKKGLIFNKFSFVKNNYDFIVLKSGQKLELDTIYKTIESKKKYINQ